MTEPENGWTLKTLYIHFSSLLAQMEKKYDERFNSQKELSSLALASADKANTKAENATEKRFEGVNEFRNTLADQQRTFIPRSEVDIIVGGLNDKIRILEDNKKGLDSSYKAIMAFLGLIIIALTIIAFFK